MTEKITTTRHIRQQLEALHQQKYSGKVVINKAIKKYKGLGLNWRDTVILILALFFVGLHHVNAENYFDLDDVDTGMMLSYHEAGNDYGALQLLSSDYTIDITGIVAQVNIKQTFQNTTVNWIQEGMYAFPVAANAAVYQMKLIIGKRIIEGEIHEKQQAQQIYEEAKSKGLSASIVKQYRPNLFTTDVANIMPNEIVQIEISYQQTLTYEAGHIDFRLPLAIKSRYMQEQFLSNPDAADLEEATLPTTTVQDNQQRKIHINLEAGFELSELKSLNHDVDIQHNKVIQSINLIDNQLYDTHDFVLRWHPIAGKEPVAAVFSEKINGQEYVLMMLLPPVSTEKIEQQREVVFIIDTSGSMQGAAMDAAKDALLFGLTQVNHTDKFNIIEFNSFARELFEQSVPASVFNLDKAIDFIDSLRSDGGTNMGPALTLAMQDEIENNFLKQIIFITDGSVGNEAQLFKQISQEITDARLFTVAIGSAPNNYFMSKAALIGKGTYTNIAKLDHVDEEMNDLFVKLSSPALTDVEIEWNTSAENKVLQNPKIIPDLYSDQPVIVTAKMQNFNKNISLSGFSNKTTFSQSFNLQEDGNSIGIAKLWARNQIEDLTDDFMLGADVDFDSIQQQITDIALEYHLVSEFTSLVAVDKTPDISRQLAMQARAETIAQAGFPQTALGWKWQMLLGLMLIGLAMFFRKTHD